MQSFEERKKSFHDNFLNFMYNIFFDYNVVDMRDDLNKIMIQEIHLRPNHEKSCFYPSFKDQNQALNVFKKQVSVIMDKLQNGQSNVRDDTYLLGDAMYFIPLEDVKKTLPVFLQ